MFDFGVPGRLTGAEGLSLNEGSLCASRSWLAAGRSALVWLSVGAAGALLSFPSFTSPSSSSAGGTDVVLVCVSNFLSTGYAVFIGITDLVGCCGLNSAAVGRRSDLTFWPAISTSFGPSCGIPDC